MVQYHMLKEMVQFNKSIFNNSYNVMEMLRDQNEKTVNSLLDQATWVPEGGKETFNNWMQLYKKGCNDFKKAVDKNYKNVENLFSNIIK